MLETKAGQDNLDRAAVMPFTNTSRVLLVKQIANEQWSFPKGGVEKGETGLEAAAREMVEETGLQYCDPASLKFEISVLRRSNYRDSSEWVGYFSMNVTDAVKGIIDNFEPNNEISAVNTFDFIEAKERLYNSADQYAIGHLAARL